MFNNKTSGVATEHGGGSLLSAPPEGGRAPKSYFKKQIMSDL